MTQQENPDRGKQADLADVLVVDALRSLQRRVSSLIVAVLLMTVMLICTLAAVFGQLVDHFASEATMFGGSLVGAALLGFGFGFAAGRVGRRR